MNRTVFRIDGAAGVRVDQCAVGSGDEAGRRVGGFDGLRLFAGILIGVLGFSGAVGGRRISAGCVCLG